MIEHPTLALRAANAERDPYEERKVRRDQTDKHGEEYR